MRRGIFDSFVMAGYECSSQRRADGRRLDLLDSTGHARWCMRDYAALAPMGIRCARDGVRWHLIEQAPHVYDWSSALPMLQAAHDNGVQVIWDLCHYGYPDDLDIWRPAFVERFARFAGAVASLLRELGNDTPLFCPINEISFWSWAGGEVGYFHPTQHRRGQELKHQLVRASIAAIEAIREISPQARFVQSEPLINVRSQSRRTRDVADAEAYRQAQFEAWDLLAGRCWPGLGGREDYLDILGANFYPQNQWFLNGPKIAPSDPDYRPLQGMLAELHQRYQRPILLSETGAEGSMRLPWLRHVAEQVAHAMRRGVPIQGLCWYPFLDYPGWDDDRYCPSGAFGYPDAQGSRLACDPLLAELAAVQARFAGPLSD